jgi:anhydro-N-acetylmuramic acid kinase
MKVYNLPFKQKKKTVIGLMSGTSLDSVDAALVEIRNSGVKSKITQKDFISFPFPPGVKELILNNSNPDSGNVTDICRINFLVSYIYIDAVNQLLKKNNLEYGDIDIIGSHGQTIHHLPAKEEFYGYSFGSTLQVGDPAIIAKNTGILTVGDFRTGDVALGGQGAPLVPYFDYVLFNSNTKNRALLNIGGISNVTYIRKKSAVEETMAFDTGPGNMLMDLICKKYFNIDYDKDGTIAASGKLNRNLFVKMIELDEFIDKTPPKSTGREYYGEIFLNRMLNEIQDVEKEDLLNTVTEFTAYAVYRNFGLHIKDFPDELYASGGGAQNKYLMKRIASYMGEKTKIKNIEVSGITIDAKEAVCFAFLANETVSFNTGNIPNVTGAGRAAILGKVCLP